MMKKLNKRRQTLFRVEGKTQLLHFTPSTLPAFSLDREQLLQTCQRLAHLPAATLINSNHQLI